MEYVDDRIERKQRALWNSIKVKSFLLLDPEIKWENGYVHTTLYETPTQTLKLERGVVGIERTPECYESSWNVNKQDYLPPRANFSNPYAVYLIDEVYFRHLDRDGEENMMCWAGMSWIRKS